MLKKIRWLVLHIKKNNFLYINSNFRLLVSSRIRIFLWIYELRQEKWPLDSSEFTSNIFNPYNTDRAALLLPSADNHSHANLIIALNYNYVKLSKLSPKVCVKLVKRFSNNVEINGIWASAAAAFSKQHNLKITPPAEITLTVYCNIRQMSAQRSKVWDNSVNMWQHNNQ